MLVIESNHLNLVELGKDQCIIDKNKVSDLVITDKWLATVPRTQSMQVLKSYQAKIPPSFTPEFSGKKLDMALP